MSNLFDSFAFSVGMLALLNPCGFALLPAYLGFFLGLDDDEGDSTILAVNRAQAVGLSMSAGFVVVFGVLGLFLAGTIEGLNQSGWLPRVTVAVGGGLVLLGIAMAAGYQPSFKIPKLNKGGGSRSLGSMFLFGVSYAVVSLSCTIPIFLIAVGSSTRGTSFGERFGSFISYAVGMGLLATVLTLAVGFGKKGLVNRFRQMLPLINRISAVILVVAGAYIVLHGIWSIQVLDVDIEVTGWIDSIVSTVDRSQQWIATWMGRPVNVLGLNTDRTTVLGAAFLLINLLIAGAGFVVRRSQVPQPEKVLVDSHS